VKITAKVSGYPKQGIHYQSKRQIIVAHFAPEYAMMSLSPERGNIELLSQIDGFLKTLLIGC